MKNNNNGYIELNDDVMEAIKHLTKNAYCIYLYFSSTGRNSDIIDYNDIEYRFGIEESDIDTAFNELMDKGYFVKRDNGDFDFYQRPLGGHPEEVIWDDYEDIDDEDIDDDRYDNMIIVKAN